MIKIYYTQISLSFQLVTTGSSPKPSGKRAKFYMVIILTVIYTVDNAAQSTSDFNRPKTRWKFPNSTIFV
jgi:hypothetical protein